MPPPASSAAAAPRGNEPAAELLPAVEPAGARLELQAYNPRTLEALQARAQELPNPMLPSTYGRRPRLIYLVRLALGFVLVVPRVLLFLLCCLAASACAKLTVLGIPREDVVSRPLSRSRKAILFGVRFFCRASLWSLGYLWVRTSGRPAPRARAPIIVANHRGFVDAVWLYWACESLSFVSAAEHLHIPVLSSLVVSGQTILVRRAEAESRARARAEIRRYATSSEPMPQVVIFPEGTVTNGQAIVSFKNGAFEPGTAVQPVLLRFPHRDLDPSWTYGNGSIPSLLARMCANPWNRLHVEYLEPLEPSSEERADATLFARRVRSAMANGLGVPFTEHTAEDTLLQGLGIARGLPADAGVVEFGALQEAYGLTRFLAKALLAEYARILTVAAGARAKAAARLSLSAWMSELRKLEPDAAAATALLEGLEEVYARLGRGRDADGAEHVGLTLREWMLALLDLRAMGGVTEASEMAMRQLAWLNAAGAHNATVPRADAVRLLAAVVERTSLAEELCTHAKVNGADPNAKAAPNASLTHGDFVKAAIAHPAVFVAAFASDAAADAAAARARAARAPSSESGARAKQPQVVGNSGTV